MKYSTFETLTIRQYQQLFALHTSDAEDVDKITQSVSILTGLSERGVDEMQMADFNKVGKEIALIFKEKAFASLREKKPKSFIKIGGKRFGVIYNPETLTTAQYVEVQTWMRSNVVENMNKIVASIVYPVKGVWPFWYRGKSTIDTHKFVSEHILDCNFLEVHAICVFFSKLWRNSINSLADYLAKEAKLKGMNPDEVRMLLKKITGGFITASELQILKT